jgi:hypothetical protein
MTEIKRENAEAVGVSVEEVEEMPLSEIQTKLREQKREKFKQNHLFGSFQLKIRDWIYKKKGGGNSLVLGELYK